jgi:hypothetical protein
MELATRGANGVITGGANGATTGGANGATTGGANGATTGGANGATTGGANGATFRGANMGMQWTACSGHAVGMQWACSGHAVGKWIVETVQQWSILNFNGGAANWSSRTVEITCFSEIFLALLEAQGTAPVQRLLVVQAMTRVTNDAQLLTDLYVNYDCGMKSVNVFEKLVSIWSVFKIES